MVAVTLRNREQVDYYTISSFGKFFKKIVSIRGQFGEFELRDVCVNYNVFVVCRKCDCHESVEVVSDFIGYGLGTQIANKTLWNIE